MKQGPFLPAAQAEFLRIFNRYEDQLPGLGADFLKEVEAAVRRISTFPEHGSPFLAGPRRVLLKRFPFSIVYQNEPDDLLIVAVAHHRRRPGYWLKRIRRKPG